MGRATNDPIYGAIRRPDGETIEPLAAPVNSGPPGSSGWSPQFAIEEAGTARYLKIADWWGGEGVKPATGYVGAAGMVATRNQASNLNAAKRFESYTVTTRTTAGTEGGTSLAIGEKRIDFAAPPFAAPPQVFVSATSNISGQPVVVEKVTVTASYVVVRASRAKGTLGSLLSTLFDLVGGITIDVLAVET